MSGQMGGAPRKVGDDEILRAILLHPDRVVTAPEIAERVELTPQGVNQRLPQLVEQQWIRKKRVGSAAAVYWVTESGLRALDSDAVH